MDCREKILSSQYADLILDFIPPARSVFPENITDYCYQTVGDYQILHINREQVPSLAVDLFPYSSTPHLYGLMQQDNFDPGSLINTGIYQIQRSPLALTGRGVILAFLDTGIDYTRPEFRDEEGNSRILAIWDQELQSGTPPEGFLYGSEYTRSMINAALESDDPYEIVPSRDELRHGSAMAGVAAGSRVNGGRTYLGAAPDADIVVVKLKQCKPYFRDYYLIPGEVPAYSEADIMLAARYAEGFAEVFKRPVVICLGVGTNQGSHAGTSPLARYLSRISAQRSRCVVVAGGNEGNAAHHFAGQLQTGANDRDNYRDVQIRVGENVRGFFMELWGNVPDLFQAAIRSPGGEMVQGVNLRPGRESSIFRFVYERTVITMESFLVKQGSGEELLVMRFEDPTPGVWNIRVRAQGEVYNGSFHMWLPIRQFVSGEVYFLEPDPYVTLTEPSMAQEVITVSTYNDANNSFFQESGRGFSRNGGIKPDLAAPGVNVDTIYGTDTGSSLAAALTAGAAAQFMEWAVVEENNIYVGGTEVKSYLIQGATRDGDLKYPNREWGYGRLNIAGTFDKLAFL